MQATQDIFESTLFEVQNAFQFKLFELNFDPSPADLTRYNLELRKFTNLKFPGSEIISQDSKLFLITKKTNDCLTFPIFVEGQKIDLTIIEQKFTKKSWKILFDQILIKNENVVRVKTGFYWLPFESFYFITRKSNIKQRIFCYFDFNIILTDEKVLISTNLQLYIQKKATFQENINEGFLLKNSKSHLLVLNLNYHNKHFKFLSVNTEQDSRSVYFSKQFQAFEPQTIQNFVTVACLQTGQSLTLSPDNFYLVEKIKYQSFNIERFYLCLKLVQILNLSPFFQSNETKIDNVSVKPHLSLPPKDFLYEIYPSETEMALSNWCFFCYQKDVDVGTEILYKIFEKLEGRFQLPLTAPRCFFIDKKLPNDSFGNFHKGFENKLTGKEQFVIVLTGDDFQAHETKSVDEYLLSKVRSHLVIDQRSNLQVELERSLALFARHHIRPRQDITKRTFVTYFIGIKDSLASESSLYLYSLTFEPEAIKTHQQFIKGTLHELFSYLEDLVKTSLTKTYLFVYKNKKGKEFTSKIKKLIGAVEDVSVTLFREAKFGIFPDLKFNFSFNSQKVNFQNLNQIVNYENHFTSRQLEGCFEHQFVECSLTNHFFVLNQNRSFELIFVQNVDVDFVNRIFSFFTNAMHDPFMMMVKVIQIIGEQN